MRNFPASLPRLAVDLTRLVGGATLVALAGLLGCSVAPAILGWKPTVVMTGSMLPRIHPGDVVVSEPAHTQKPIAGEVVLVDDPARPGRLLMHRVVRVLPDGSLVTKGDANATADSTPVPAANLRGFPALRIPMVGLPVVWWSDRRYGLVAAAGLAVLCVVSASLITLPERETVDEAPRYSVFPTTLPPSERAAATT